MTDFLETKRDEIAARLRELEPLVAEYNQLEAAAAALTGLPTRAGEKPSNTRPRRRATAPSAAPKVTTPARRRGRPRGSGTRALQAIELVKAQPGITTTELATAMGIKQNYLYRVLPALAKDKKVVRRRKGWHASDS